MNTTPELTGTTEAGAERCVRRVIDSPIGPLTLEATDRGLTTIHFGALDDTERPAASAADDPAAHLATAEQQLGEYFAGRRTTFELVLAPHGTPFQQAAWQQLRSIPFGDTWTYGEQARRMGDSRKSRAVGAANGRNPLPIVVPCHRVVGADGKLTGFAGGLPAKAWLLDHEREVLSRAAPGAGSAPGTP